MERDTSVTVTDDSTGNFNSHAHVERDYSLILPIAYLKISTHTLTWSVTEYISKNLGKSIISTHTLTWSVTCQYGLMHS